MMRGYSLTSVGLVFRTVFLVASPSPDSYRGEIVLKGTGLVLGHRS